jgi:hypothetical protein
MQNQTVEIPGCAIGLPKLRRITLETLRAAIGLFTQ